jgi:hypothetical protein
MARVRRKKLALPRNKRCPVGRFAFGRRISFRCQQPRIGNPWDSDIRKPKPRRQGAIRRAAINHRAACERSPAGLGWGYSQMPQNSGGWEEKPRRALPESRVELRAPRVRAVFSLCRNPSSPMRHMTSSSLSGIMAKTAMPTRGPHDGTRTLHRTLFPHSLVAAGGGELLHTSVPSED